MSFIATTKFGDCYECGKQNTNVVKVGKHTFCLSCRNSQKNKVSLDKAAQREKDRRALAADSTKVRNLGYDIEAGKENDTLNLWFKARRSEMTGVCLFCGGKTSKEDDKAFKRSVGHLLAKRKNMFPSVKTHPDNWLELCFWDNSCHTNFDNGIITWEFLRDSKEWDIIVTKFKKIYPAIALHERGRIPQILLDTLNEK